MEYFAEIINGFCPLYILVKWSLLDMFRGSEYAFGELHWNFSFYFKVKNLIRSFFVDHKQKNILENILLPVYGNTHLQFLSRYVW